ncbi:hypothetical protein NLX71_09390 [Paenibacillus sp. MZ04-78.2]|uniref:hypothetical protein n=1 Tax=Paenibacillus sp. MZ04-78.2 TaxID=2962034 RepID=UPI0020B86838|nr:hypothetical protein [Paenibacillus sp. MZ04-78.2]MCP3773523.1 hypothetical protein [Paenibacillus sp. MZ04-78.2]
MNRTTGEQTYTTTEGAKHVNNAQVDIWGIYRGASLHLVTNYTVNSTSIKIDDTNTSGTKDLFPVKVDVKKNATLSNSDRNVASYAEYLVTFIHEKLGASNTWRLETHLKVLYAGNGSITFTAETKWFY